MSVLTLEDAVVSRLKQLHEETEIRDEQGNLVGTFTPSEAEFYDQKIPQHILDKFDPAELERRSQSKERGRTLDEIKKRWKEMEQAS